MQPTKWPLSPRHYQLTGIDYMTTLRVKQKETDLFPTCARSLNDDAPGSGKSLQSSEAASQLVPLDTGSIVVLTPAHLVPQWYDFLCKQYPNDNVVSIEGTQSKRNYYANIPSRWYVISIQSMRSKSYFDLMQSLFIRQHVQCTIIDESHYVKNRDAKQSHYIRELTEPQFCKHVILLSATPIMREADDLWHQLRIIDPINFRSHDRFLNTYCWFSWTSWGAQNITLRKGASDILQATKLPNPSNNLLEQTYDLQSGWILGRSYEEIGLELPRLISPDPILTQFTPKRRKYYNDIKNQWSVIFADHANDDQATSFNANSAMEVMHTLRRIINSPEKQESLSSYLESDQGPYFIVCDYKWSVRDLKAHIDNIKDSPYRVTSITGEIPSNTRIELAKQMSQNPNDIIIATMGSIPEGADLSLCNTVYFYEQATTPGRMHQVLSRVRRHRNKTGASTGEVIITEDNKLILPLMDIDPNERPVMCRYFHVEGTLDQRIHAVCYNRAINIKDIIKVELNS